MTCPVISLASSPRSMATAGATSSVRQMPGSCRSGSLPVRNRSDDMTPCATTRSVPGVSMNPGATALTRISCWPSVRANERVREIRAPFDAAYASAVPKPL